MTRKLSSEEAGWDFTPKTEGTIVTNDDGKLQTVLLELDLAIAFSAPPISVGTTTKTYGNIENARKAFNEGLRFLFKVGLPLEEGNEVIEKLALLSAKLRDLDQQVISAPVTQIS